jgi:hypothetical protein
VSSRWTKSADTDEELRPASGEYARLPRLAGFTNIAAAGRHHARDSNRPLNLLGVA